MNFYQLKYGFVYNKPITCHCYFMCFDYVPFVCCTSNWLPHWKLHTVLSCHHTHSFNCLSFFADNIIGKGGYAEVYKGCLENGQLVAVKKLTRGTVDERTGYFLSELGIIVHVNHPNTAKLVGFSIEGGVHLVFQLSARGSLASVLHGNTFFVFWIIHLAWWDFELFFYIYEGSKKKLDWSVRYKVAVGTAEGLEYLHVRCQRRIIHRDIKAANILLTEDFEPQVWIWIWDFGFF